MAGIGRKKANTKTDMKRDWTASGSFINKPSSGWLHPDDQLDPGAGICYGIIYVGCMEVKESMKTLDFETRTAVAKESISRVCEAAGLKTEAKRPKRNAKVGKLLGDEPNMLFAGSNINLTITTDRLTLMVMETGDIIGNHDMPGISFASGGDPDTMDFVAYVAKDDIFGRACHVLECGGGLAQDVITTIGQAFELRFKLYLANKTSGVTAVSVPDRHSIPSYAQPIPRHLRPLPVVPQHVTNGDSWGNGRSDRDYYNDRLPPTAPDFAAVQGGTKPESGEHMARDGVGINIEEEVRCAEVYDNSLKRKQGSADHGANMSVSQSSLEGAFLSDAQYFAPKTDGASAASSPPADVQSISDLDHQFARTGASGPASNKAPDQVSLSSASDIQDAFSMQPLSSSLSSDSWSAAVQQGKPSVGLLPYHEPWFHGKISRQQVEQLLRVDGDFLVRESTNTPGQFVLSGRHSGKIKHLLLVDPEGVVRTKDRTFDSISHLIQHHKSGRIPISSADSELRLLHPIVRS